MDANNRAKIPEGSVPPPLTSQHVQKSARALRTTGDTNNRIPRLIEAAKKFGTTLGRWIQIFSADLTPEGIRGVLL